MRSLKSFSLNQFREKLRSSLNQFREKLRSSTHFSTTASSPSPILTGSTNKRPLASSTLLSYANKSTPQPVIFFKSLLGIHCLLVFFKDIVLFKSYTWFSKSKDQTPTYVYIRSPRRHISLYGLNLQIQIRKQKLRA